jgi:hypothetical protein
MRPASETRTRRASTIAADAIARSQLRQLLRLPANFVIQDAQPAARAKTQRTGGDVRSSLPPTRPPLAPGPRVQRAVTLPRQPSGQLRAELTDEDLSELNEVVPAGRGRRQQGARHLTAACTLTRVWADAQELIAPSPAQPQASRRRSGVRAAACGPLSAAV